MTDLPETKPSAHLVDALIESRLNEIAARNNGVYLGLARQEDGEFKLLIEETLRPLDTRLAPAQPREAVLDTTESLIQFTETYGDKSKTLVMYNGDDVTATLDYEIDEGLRETGTMTFSPGSDMRAWLGAVNTPCNHRDLVKFLSAQEHNLIDPNILLAMRSAPFRGEVVHDSEIQDDGATIGMMYKTTAGEELKRFPKKFRIGLPVLDTDLTDTWAGEVRMEVYLPTEPGKSPTFIMRSPQILNARRERAAQEGQKIIEALDGWRVMAGRSDYKSQAYAKDNGLVPKPCFQN